MTDKQIIIDGIDVGGCIYYKDGKCLNGEIVQCNCKNVAVCYYKEYKRKEQECERLTSKCSQLKAERDSYIDKYFLESQKVVNLRKVLREIKEICNSNDELKGDFNLVDCDKYKLGKHNLANRILQKISECEVE